MPSINSRDLVIEIMNGDGYYSDDPQCLAIHSYINNWGGKTYHLAYKNDDIKSLQDSPYCRDIRLLWSRVTGITLEGEKLVSELRRY